MFVFVSLAHSTFVAQSRVSINVYGSALVIYTGLPVYDSF